MAKKEPDKFYFIEKAKEKFNNVYTYDMESWVSNKDKLRIFCPVHGEFFQTPTAHYTGNGCPNCYYDKRRKKGETKFFEDAQRIHGDLYDYSKSVFVNKTTKMIIICMEHGEFLQDAACHINQRQGCPTCGVEKCTKSRKETYNQDWFVSEAKKLHGDLYGYSKVVYKTSSEKVIITCRKHGDFLQKPAVHLQSQGCKACSVERRTAASLKGLEQWVKEAKAKHGDKYAYTKSVYLGNNHKITVTCPEHGDFSLIPIMHLRGNGCPPCGLARRSKKRSGNILDFIKKAKKVHGDKYQYSGGDYTTSKEKIKITCPKHGEFYQQPNSHLGGHGCIKCSNQISQFEDKIEKFLIENNVRYIKGDRTGVAGKGTKYNLELDFYLPDYNLAIEVNGEKWHSSAALNQHKTWDWVRNHQKRKLLNCAENGVQLLHFYAEEIGNRFPQVTSMIKAKMGVNTESIAARKTEVRDVDRVTSEDYLNRYHIQGVSPQKIAKGLYYQDELVSLMVFGKLQSHRGNQDTSKYELIRYCSSKRVVGGCSKLLKAFIKETPECKTVVSYADRRLSDGKMYESMGFTMVRESAPDYCYISDSFEGKKHKANYRRLHLPKKLPNFNPVLTERENCQNNGIYQLFDCGKLRYELKVSP